jgi:hypothetical protein
LLGGRFAFGKGITIRLGTWKNEMNVWEWLLIGVLTILNFLLLVVFPFMVAKRVDRWFNPLLDTFFKRTRSPTARWILTFVGYELASQEDDTSGWRKFGSDTDIPPPLVDLAVEPGRGYGPAKFGMSPDRVVAVLGQPLDYDAWDDGNTNDSLIYEGARLVFDRCDGKGPLTRSRFDNAIILRQDALLFGRRLVDWSESELLAELTRQGLPGYAEPELGLVAMKTPYLRTWFENGQITEVWI